MLEPRSADPDAHEQAEARLRLLREREDALEELECRMLRRRLFGTGAAPDRPSD